MNDKKPAEKKRGKKLEINKETIQELSDDQLEQVAGGFTGGCYDGVQRNAQGGTDTIAPGPTRVCNAVTAACAR